MASNGEDPTAISTKDTDANEEGDEEHIEGDPRPLPYAFEKELINKSNKHIRVRDGFVPVNKVYTLTSKFYAKHEQIQPKHLERFLLFTQVSQSERHTKLGLPLLESQVYGGWLPLNIETDLVKGLNFINAPKQRSRMTIHGEHLIAERVTERPSFNGLRFLLQ